MMDTASETRATSVRGCSRKDWRVQRAIHHLFGRAYGPVPKPGIRLPAQVAYAIKRVCQELHLAPGPHTLHFFDEGDDIFSLDADFGIETSGQVHVSRHLRRQGWQELLVGVFVRSDRRLEVGGGHVVLRRTPTG